MDKPSNNEIEKLQPRNIELTTTSAPNLFSTIPSSTPTELPELTERVIRAERLREGALLTPAVNERLLEIYSRVTNPDDAIELRNLYLGRIEVELGSHSLHPHLANIWNESKSLRHVKAQDILTSRVTSRFIKELFNWFFRDDLYGALRSDDHIILSSGSVDETAYGLQSILKECIRYTLDRDWYGYSDSRGRSSTREAIAAFENARIEGAPYNSDRVAITLGGTFAVSALADFIMANHSSTGSPALCAIPNYPPLVEAIARRSPIELVPTTCGNGTTSLALLIDTLRPSTPLVLIQTVTNPTGTPVNESELERLILTAHPNTMILLDECHECLGALPLRSKARSASNVVRISSLSKTLSIPGMKIGWILAEEAFITDYYEYASTTYGGPPSFTYLLTEIMARMELWMLTDIDHVGPAQLREFEATYGLNLVTLDAAYQSYRRDRQMRDVALIKLRRAAVLNMDKIGVDLVHPSHSINLTLRLQSCDDDYKEFRTVLAATGVAIFPNILTFCLDGGWIRLTTARRWPELCEALRRLDKFWE